MSGNSEVNRLLAALTERFKPHLYPFMRPRVVEMLTQPMPEDEVADAARGLAAVTLAERAGQACATDDDARRAYEGTLKGLEPRLMSQRPVDAALEAEYAKAMTDPPTEEMIDAQTEKESARLARGICLQWYRAAQALAVGSALDCSGFDADGLPPGDWLEAYKVRGSGWNRPDVDLRAALLSFIASMEPAERPFPPEFEAILKLKSGIAVIRRTP